MGFFKSFSKSRKLRKISKNLASPITDFKSLMSNKKDKALAELLDLCESDPNVRYVMDRHNASRDVLEEIYHILCAVGAGQWVSGHYVAASALCYGATLDYLLSKWANLIKEGSKSFPTPPAFRVIKYFEDGETGGIQY
jgi:hypothetical protein